MAAPSDPAFGSVRAKAAIANVTQGYIQPADAQRIIYEAVQSGVGGPTPAQREAMLDTLHASGYLP